MDKYTAIVHVAISGGLLNSKIVSDYGTEAGNGNFPAAITTSAIGLAQGKAKYRWVKLLEGIVGSRIDNIVQTGDTSCAVVPTAIEFDLFFFNWENFCTEDETHNNEKIYKEDALKRVMARVLSTEYKDRDVYFFDGDVPTKNPANVKAGWKYNRVDVEASSDSLSAAEAKITLTVSEMK